MLRLTTWRCSPVGASITAASQHSRTPKECSGNSESYTVRPRTRTSQRNLVPSHSIPLPKEALLTEFKRFYEAVTRSKAKTRLPPTPLGHGGSERILNNDLLHKSPWQASCVELRERPMKVEKKMLSYGQIDFAKLRRESCRWTVEEGAAPSSASPSSKGSYSNIEGMAGPSQSCSADEQGPGLDVVHYYETSSPEGLAGYQQVALQVRKGQLPGSCTNYSAEGGFAVWVVPHGEYLAMVSSMGYLPAPT